MALPKSLGEAGFSIVLFMAEALVGERAYRRRKHYGLP